jgi:inhibitor of cysteine peptidase
MNIDWPHSPVRSLLRMVALAGATWIGASGAFCGADAGKAAAMLTFSENDDGRTAEVRVGETVAVTLAENASTGYRWTVDRLDADFVRQLSAESRNPAKPIGAPGTIVFTFEAVKAGTGEIAFKYWRSWEGDTSVTKRFRVRLSVQP